MTERRLPAGFNTADENDTIQKGANGLWYTRGAAEAVPPNIKVSVSNTYAMPSRLGARVTLEVDTSQGSWSSDTVTLTSAAIEGDIVRIVDVGGGNTAAKVIRVLPGSGTIAGQTEFSINSPFSSFTVYRTSAGSWAVLGVGGTDRMQQVVTGTTTLIAAVISMNHTVFVDTSGSWPGGGGAIVLPAVHRRGARVTITEISGNGSSKEVGVVGAVGGTLIFKNPFGSVTFEDTGAAWQIVASYGHLSTKHLLCDDVSATGHITAIDVAASANVTALNVVELTPERQCIIREDFFGITTDLTFNTLRADYVWNATDTGSPAVSGTAGTVKNPGVLRVAFGGSGADDTYHWQVGSSASTPFSFAAVQQFEIVMALDDDASNADSIMRAGLTVDNNDVSGGANHLVVQYRKTNNATHWAVRWRKNNGTQVSSPLVPKVNGEFVAFRFRKNASLGFDVLVNDVQMVTVTAGELPAGSCTFGGYAQHQSTDFGLTVAEYDYVGLRCATGARHD